MKKYASILALFVLLLGFVATSYSAPASVPSDTTAVIAKGKTQITLGGDLRFRGWYGKNLSVRADDTYPDNTAYYDYRVRLSLEAKVSPNTTGFIELEGASALTSDSADWGSASGGARGSYRQGNTKEATVHVRQAWIQYQGTGLLGVPAGIKVGRQLIKLGYGLFYDHTFFGDDAILVFVQPVKELTLSAYHIKWWEGDDHTALRTTRVGGRGYYSIGTLARARELNNDSTGYGILAAYAGKGWGLSGDITYVDHQNLPLRVDLYIPFTSTDYFLYGNITIPTGIDVHLWNIGLRGNVDDIAGTGLSFKADVEFQTGKIRDLTPERKLNGWAAMAGLDYKFKTIPLSLTLEYAIGSGDKAATTDKDESFITALGPEQHYTFIYEYLTPSACNFGGSTSTAVNRTGLCNTQYVKFGGAYDITKDLKAELYGYWLRAHRAVAINRYTAGPSKDLGWEVDAKLTYKIDRGLTYFVDAAYFWPGDAYRLQNTGNKADDAWALRHGIQLRF